MTFYPSSELLLDPSPMRVVNTPSGQLARAAARGAVAARRMNPLPFAGPVRGGRVGLIVSLALEAWNLFSQDQAPAPLTSVVPAPTPLGQLYRVQGSALVLDNLFPPGTVSSTPVLVENVTGPVGEISIRVGSAGEAVYVTALDGQPTQNELQASTGVGVGGRFKYQSLETIVVTPMGGGDPVPGLFPTPAPVSQPTLSPDVAMPLALPQSPGVIPITILIPTVIPRPSDLGRRPVPLLYPPTLTPAQREALPPIWFLPEGVQVGRGYADDRVTSTTGNSVDVDIDIDLLSDYQIRNPPDVVTCNAEPDPPGDCCSCDDIRDIVIEELDSKFPPARPFGLRTEIIPAGESNTFVLPEFTQWVELRIVTPPPGVREQTGGSLAPAARYNGWYSFGATGEASERIPFHYDFVSIKIPHGISAFSYTVYSGGTAQATIGYFLEE